MGDPPRVASMRDDRAPAHRVAAFARSLVPRTLADAAPGVALLRRYPRSFLRPDLIAGITVGAVAVPSALAMAELAGVPVQYGLYGTFLPLALYALFATSRQHVIGPDSTLAALTAVTVAPLARVDGQVDPSLYVALSAALALAMGLLVLAAGLLRLGFVADFFGKPVLIGYINGVALTVIASQLAKLLGISVAARDFFPIIRETLSELGDANGATVLLSAFLLALAFSIKRLLPVVPASLVVLAVSLLLAAVVDLPSRGVAVVGDVEQGLPSLGLPDVGIGRFVELLLPAAAFGLVAFADLTATVRTFAQKHGYAVDANAELRALGIANLGGGLTGAFPVSSSNSRSAVNDAAGARSQAAILVAAGVVGLFLLVAMPLIEPLPKATLGVIIVVAAASLIDVRAMWRLRHVRPAEVGLAVLALGGVLVFGVLGGVAIAIATSIGVFLQRAARPHDAVLGRVEGVDGFHDVDGWPDVQTTPGLLVYRFDATPFFVNAEYLRQRVLGLVEAEREIEWVVLDAEAWTYLDATAVDALEQLHHELAEQGVTLCFARLKARGREIFADTGLTEQIGAERLYPTVRTAVAAFEEHRAATGSAQGDASPGDGATPPGS